MKNNTRVVIISLSITLFLFISMVLYKETFSSDTYELNTTYFVDNESRILFVGSETSTQKILEGITVDENIELKIIDNRENEINGFIYDQAFLNIKFDDEDSIDYRIVVMYLYPSYNEMIINTDNVIGYVELDTKISELINMIDLNFEYPLSVTRDGNVIENADSTMHTGDKLVIKFNDNSSFEYELSLVGDVSGNGTFDLNDVVNASRFLVKWINPRTNLEYELSKGKENAIDITKNGSLDLNDVVTMNRIIVGMREYNKVKHTGTQKYGDVNLDGEVDFRDVLRLRRYLGEFITFGDVETHNADLNDDSVIDNYDLTILIRHLNNEDGYDVLPYTGSIMNEDNPQPIIGDINNDEIVDNRDCNILIQYLSGGIQLTDEQLNNADLNQDGNVDIIDRTIFDKKMAEWESFQTFPYTGTILFGDVNGDGSVNDSDDELLEEYIAGTIQLTEIQLFNGDLNLDNVVDAADSIILLNYINGEEGYESLPYLGEVSSGED